MLFFELGGLLDLRGTNELGLPDGVGLHDLASFRTRNGRWDLARGVHVELLENLRADNRPTRSPELGYEPFRHGVAVARIHVVRVDQDVGVDEALLPFRLTLDQVQESFI
jgi:hypothetical protein